MSVRVVRHSKFRHVYGKAEKKDNCYENIRITKSGWDSQFCAVNPKYLAVITESGGGGSFLVLPLNKTGRVEMNSPQVVGHRGAVLDIAWCPHNDDVIASASEDCTVMVWTIPNGGLHTNLTEPAVVLMQHERRVGLIQWHPSAFNVLLSAGSDNKIIVWDVGRGMANVIITMPAIIYSVAWNYNGSKIVTSCKDKYLRILDPRTTAVIAEGKGHAGSKTSNLTVLKDGRIFTTGFSKMSDRQYGLWQDKGDGTIENLVEEDIDQSNGVLFPMYDVDTGVVYIAGKGDSKIMYFEVEGDNVYYLNSYSSKDPQRGIGMMPKRGLDVNICEVARFYKLHQKGLCEPISMIVPRKSELFQDDLYPDTASDVPAITAEQFFSGMDADPVLVTMKSGYKAPNNLIPASKPNILNKLPMKKAAVSGAVPQAKQENVSHAPVVAAVTPAREEKPAASLQAHTPARPTPAPAPAATPVPTSAPAPQESALPPGFDVEQIMSDIRKLKIIVKGHEKRIKSLEDKLAEYEVEVTDESDVGES
ncbi:coronin-1C isoform X2 [Lingula anatina]|uniref:Coronin n=1 Tax=Lingula anatina TaxID=7574 RepID=A0A1S3HX52_LINAN|nr:coronin-1C isoform X2 [Lingula anatina]XP_013389644.1 coronin-1C isoform X2 [Lingula anatina]|eukprot:XP_013389643.1 coronin-1C isoform X2 [Lingula anatina]